jgi:MFS family permease
MSRLRCGEVDATLVRLLLASFVVALATTGFVFAVPFYVLAKLGRTDAVGQVVAAWTFGYIVSCLLAQSLSARFSPRILVIAATVGVGIFVFLFRFTQSVSQMSAMAMAYGLSLGFFWAPLMGWLSGHAEGVALSRRLGLFNLAWSTSVILAPLIASYLVRHSITLPFGVMAVIMVLAFGVVATTRRERPRAQSGVLPVTAAATGDPVSPEPAAPVLNADTMQYIRYLAWIGAAVGYTAVSVFRFQMPHLAKTIHMDEVVFGRVIVSLSLAITIAFFVLTRWAGWHGRARWIFLPQLLLVIVSVLLTWTTSAWAMVPLMLAAGLAAGMLYTSSVFHGSLGAAPTARTRRMAIHEICLNIGVILGSYFGNLLSQHLGPSRVYPYLALAIAVAILVQAIGWGLLVRGARHSRVAALARNPLVAA